MRRLPDEFVHGATLVIRRGGGSACCAAGPPSAGPHPIEGVSTMTACMPDDPAYCFVPLADKDGEPP